MSLLVVDGEKVGFGKEREPLRSRWRIRYFNLNYLCQEQYHQKIWSVTSATYKWHKWKERKEEEEILDFMTLHFHLP